MINMCKKLNIIYNIITYNLSLNSRFMYKAYTFYWQKILTCSSNYTLFKGIILMKAMKNNPTLLTVYKQ